MEDRRPAERDGEAKLKWSRAAGGGNLMLQDAWQVTTGEAVVILGASARAAAQWAVGRGLAPWCVDLFADTDLQKLAEAAGGHVARCDAANYPWGMLAILAGWTRGPRSVMGEAVDSGGADGLPSDAPVLLTGAMERFPDFVAALERRHRLVGCSAAAMRAVRDPGAFASLPDVEGVGRVAYLTHSAGIVTGDWLVKPVLGAGGAGIHRWPASSAATREHQGAVPARTPTPTPEAETEALNLNEYYLQKVVAGPSISLACWAGGELGAGVAGAGDDGRLLRVHVTRQLVGEAWLGAGPFQYAGSLAAHGLSADQLAACGRLAMTLAQTFDLRGPFGVDAIVGADGLIYPVETNPRFTASMEINFHSFGFGFGVGSDGGRRTDAVIGKAVAYAKRACAAPVLRTIFDPRQVADIPAPGQRFATGEPICTLLARRDGEASAVHQLQALAHRLYTHLT